MVSSAATETHMPVPELTVDQKGDMKATDDTAKANESSTDENPIFWRDEVFPETFAKIKNGRSHAAKLQMALYKRIEAERRYSRDLAAIAVEMGDEESNKEETYDDDCQEALDGLQTYLSRLAASHDQLARNLQEDAHQMLTMMIINHKEVLSNMERDLTDLSEKDDSFSDGTVELNNALKEHSDGLKERMIEVMRLHPCLQIHEHEQKMKTFLDNSLVVMDECTKLEHLINARNRFSQKSLTQKSYVVSSLEDMNQKRRACCKDALAKCIVYELACLRNAIYDAEQVQPAVDKFEPSSRHLIDDDVNNRHQIHPGEVQLIQAPHWYDVTNAQHKKSRSLATQAALTKVVQNIAGGGRFWLSNIVQNFTAASTMSELASRRSASASSYASAPQEGSQTEDTGISGTLVHAHSGGFDESDTDALIHEAPSVSLDDFDLLLEQIAKGAIPSVPDTIEQHIGRYYSLINAVNSNDVSVLTLEAGERFKDELSSSVMRGVLLEAAARVFDKCGGRLKSMLALRVLTKLFLWGLDWSDSQNDVFFAQWVVCNAKDFTAAGTKEDDPQLKSWHWPKNDHHRSKLQAKSESQKRKFSAAEDSGDVLTWTIHHGIYNHRLLNHVAFWEEMLLALLGNYRLLQFLEEWWNADPTRYSPETIARYRVIYTLKIACCLHNGLKNFPSIMQSYGILHAQIEHMIMKLTVSYKINPELLTEMYTGYSFDEAKPQLDSPTPVASTVDCKNITRNDSDGKQAVDQEVNQADTMVIDLENPTEEYHVTSFGPGSLSDATKHNNEDIEAKE